MTWPDFAKYILDSSPFIAGLLVAIVIIVVQKKGVKIPFIGMNDNQSAIAAAEIMLLLHKNTEMAVNTCYIKHVIIIRDQLKLARETLDEIMSRMKSTYLELYEKEIGDAKCQTSGLYQQYNRLLDDMRGHVYDKIESHFAENGLLEIENYHGYVEAKVQSLTQFTVGFLNDNYYHPVLTREKLYDENLRDLSERENLMESLYFGARKIAERHTAEIKRMENSFQEDLKLWLQKKELEA